MCSTVLSNCYFRFYSRLYNSCLIHWCLHFLPGSFLRAVYSCPAIHDATAVCRSPCGRMAIRALWSCHPCLSFRLFGRWARLFRRWVRALFLASIYVTSQCHKYFGWLFRSSPINTKWHILIGLWGLALFFPVTVVRFTQGGELPELCVCVVSERNGFSPPSLWQRSCMYEQSSGRFAEATLQS